MPTTPRTSVAFVSSLAGLLLAFQAWVGVAENYPQFRGENANAVSPVPLPVRWSDADCCGRGQAYWGRYWGV